MVPESRRAKPMSPAKTHNDHFSFAEYLCKSEVPSIPLSVLEIVLDHEVVKISHIATHLIVVLLLVLLLVGATSSKKPEAPSFQIMSG